MKGKSILRQVMLRYAPEVVVGQVLEKVYASISVGAWFVLAPTMHRETLRAADKIMAKRKSALPNLKELHVRHPGLYEPLCKAYADAAAICLADHESPADLEIYYRDSSSVRELSWDEPTQDARASWANRDNATEQGAYSVSLATVEAELGFVALSRAETRTGADYYIGLPGTDLEESYRLEVSGTRSGEVRKVNTRLGEKVSQARRGHSDRPAFACVVGFSTRTVVMAEVKDHD